MKFCILIALLCLPLIGLIPAPPVNAKESDSDQACREKLMPKRAFAAQLVVEGRNVELRAFLDRHPEVLQVYGKGDYLEGLLSENLTMIAFKAGNVGAFRLFISRGGFLQWPYVRGSAEGLPKGELLDSYYAVTRIHGWRGRAEEEKLHARVQRTFHQAITDEVEVRLAAAVAIENRLHGMLWLLLKRQPQIARAGNPNLLSGLPAEYANLANVAVASENSVALHRLLRLGAKIEKNSELDEVVHRTRNQDLRELYAGSR